MGRFDGILICSDVDGTVALGGNVPEENQKAIARFQGEGGRFTLATGRPAGYEKGLPLPINAPIVSDNGTRITDCESGRTLWTFPLDGCWDLLEWLDEVGCPRITLDFEDGLVVAENGCVADTVFSHKTGDLLKVVCSSFASEEDALVFRDQGRARFGERYQVHRSWATGVEFISPLGGKGNCLRFLRQICEDVHTVVGVGDYENDLSMVAAVDRFFAPENACPDILSVAPHVVCSCAEGAIAAVIRALDASL